MWGAQDKTKEYLKTQVQTASREQLILMLYDGAIRFIRQGQDALAAGNLEVSCDKFLRAQKIVLELKAGLRPEADAALCSNVGSIYNYIYRRLIDANIQRSGEAATEALHLLDYQRQTWVLLMDKLAGRTPSSPAPVAVDVAG